ASVRNTLVADDLFIADTAIPLDFADGGGLLTGMVVRNNLFVPLAGQGVATTSPRAARLMGPLPAGSVNDPTAWFASSANDVALRRLGDRFSWIGRTLKQSRADDLCFCRPKKYLSYPAPGKSELALNEPRSFQLGNGLVG